MGFAGLFNVYTMMVLRPHRAGGGVPATGAARTLRENRLQSTHTLANQGFPSYLTLTHISLIPGPTLRGNCRYR